MGLFNYFMQLYRSASSNRNEVGGSIYRTVLFYSNFINFRMDERLPVGVFGDSGTVMHSIALDQGLHLTHTSSKANGYMSTLTVRSHFFCIVLIMECLLLYSYFEYVSKSKRNSFYFFTNSCITSVTHFKKLLNFIKNFFQLSLLGPRLPLALRLIRVSVDVAGNHEEHLLEAVANLTFTYNWDRRDVYAKRKVFGLTPAKGWSHKS